MNLNITQSNLYLLIPGKVAGVARIYAEENGVTILDAMKKFYATPLYLQLCDEATKLWHYGAVALYEKWQEE